MLYYQIKSLINLKTLILTQIIILICAFFMTTAFNGYIDQYKESNKISIGIVNNDLEDSLSNLLLDNFNNNKNFTSLFTLINGNSEEISRKFTNDEIDSYIIIPKGFSQGLMHYETQNITIYTKAKNPTKNLILNQVFNSYGNFIKSSNLATFVFYDLMDEEGFDSEKLSNLNKFFSIEMVSSTISRDKLFEIKTNSELPLVSSKRYFLMAIPLAFICFICVNSALNSIKNRNTWLNKRLYLCSKSEISMHISIYISEIAATFSSIILIIILQFIFNSFNQALINSIVLFIAIIFFTTAWKFISNIFKTAKSMSIFSTTVAFILCIFGGCIIPFNILPTWIKSTGVYSPIYNFLRLSLDVQNSTLLDLINQFTIWFIIITVLILADYIVSKKIRET